MSKQAYLDIVSRHLARRRSADHGLAVLEAPIGVGETARGLVQLLKVDDTFLAIDTDADMVEDFRSWWDDASPPCRLGGIQVADLRDLSVIESGTIDVVSSDTAVNLLGYELPAALDEIHRVLAADGQVFIRELLPPGTGVANGRDLLLRSVVAARSLDPQPYVMLPVELVSRLVRCAGFEDVRVEIVRGTDQPLALDVRNWHPFDAPAHQWQQALLDHYDETIASLDAPRGMSDAYVLTGRKPPS